MKRVLATPAFSHFLNDWHLAPVVDTGDFVFFSGVTGTHPDLSVSGNPETQFRDTFTYLKAENRGQYIISGRQPSAIINGNYILSRAPGGRRGVADERAVR